MAIKDFPKTTDNSRDEVLWTRFKEGEETAFYEIYDKYAHLLYNYGIKFTCDHGLVEDCIHDLFVNLWENRANISHVQHPKFYLYISLRRKVIRSEQRKNRYITEDHGESRFSVRITASVEDTIILEQAAADRSHQLNKAILGLSARQREIIFLKYYENFSSEEIASIMSINIESVYKLSTKALNTIRNLIKEGVIFFSVSIMLWLVA